RFGLLRRVRQSLRRAVMDMAELPDIARIGARHVVALAKIFLRHPNVVEIEAGIRALGKPENILMTRREAAHSPHALRIVPGDPALRGERKLLLQHQIETRDEAHPHKAIERAAGLKNAEALSKR